MRRRENVDIRTLSGLHSLPQGGQLALPDFLPGRQNLQIHPEIGVLLPESGDGLFQDGIHLAGAGVFLHHPDGWFRYFRRCPAAAAQGQQKCQYGSDQSPDLPHVLPFHLLLFYAAVQL